MRIGGWKPYPADRMDKEYPWYTVCEVIRQIYHKVDDPEVKLKCRIAISMTKAMDAKLLEYNALYGDAFWVGKTEDAKKEVNRYLELT
jgi:hypothetical protein